MGYALYRRGDRQLFTNGGMVRSANGSTLLGSRNNVGGEEMGVLFVKYNTCMVLLPVRRQIQAVFKVEEGYVRPGQVWRIGNFIDVHGLCIVMVSSQVANEIGDNFPILLRTK